MARGQINYSIERIAECYELSEARQGKFGYTFENRIIRQDVVDDSGELMRPGVYQKRYGGYNNYGYSKKYPKYCYYMRISYNPPSDPKTKKQQARRQKMARAVSAWHDLPESEKEKYRAKARNQRYSGYNLFIKEYMNQPDVEFGFPYSLPCKFGKSSDFPADFPYKIPCKLGT